MPTVRETVATLLNNHPRLVALGLPQNAVFQADTTDSIMIRPFLVIRWLPEIAGMGESTRRPFTIWSYDDVGDYSRSERIGREACSILKELAPIAVEAGWLTQISGGRRGQDMRDTGYEANVIPYECVAIATGV